MKGFTSLIIDNEHLPPSPSGTSQTPFSQVVFQLLWVHLHLSVSTVERQHTKMKIKQDDAISRNSIAKTEYKAEKIPLPNHDEEIHKISNTVWD